jgi:predicted RNase H-like nuclease (RuvC/YqgF family)
MVRTNKKSELSVSLFPFLSILACVMGTLTLIIYGVALGQTPSGTSPEAHQKVRDRTAELTAEIEQLKTVVAQAQQGEKRLSGLRDQRAQLLSRLSGSPEQRNLAVALLPRYEEFLRQLRDLEEQLAQSTREIQRLEKAIKTTAEQLDRTRPVVPAPRMTQRTPAHVAPAEALVTRPSTRADTKGAALC